MSPLRARLVCVAVFAGSAVTATCTTGFPSRVPLGNWGSLHAGMVVSDTGAEIEYDCAAGRISVPMTLDSHGDFDLPGLYIREAGPVPANDSLLPKFPARYTGHTDGRTMSLTMTVESDSTPQQTFALTYGGNPNVFKCV